MIGDEGYANKNIEWKSKKKNMKRSNLIISSSCQLRQKAIEIARNLLTMMRQLINFGVVLFRYLFFLPILGFIFLFVTMFILFMINIF